MNRMKDGGVYSLIRNFLNLKWVFPGLRPGLGVVAKTAILSESKNYY